jgi:conjugal transfer/entry exclusion protein
MKKTLSLFLLVTASVVPASAQWAVFDGANFRQSLTNYGVLMQQIARQATQIENQIQQIRRADLQIERAGDMAQYRNLVGFDEVRIDLRLPTHMRRWSDRRLGVDGRGIFGDTRGGIFPGINVEYPNFDGTRLGRDPEIFRQPHDIVLTVNEFMEVQSEVYQRREDLKRAIARTSEAMQAATTEAEQQKLQAVLEVQYGQLAAVDAEVALSAAEVQVKTAEATAMNEARMAAEAETRRRLAQQEAGKLGTTFVPTYECMLQYVTEQRLSP